MTRIRWTASRDGIAHAWRSARGFTLCGLWPIEERYAWPTRTRCPACLGAATAKVPA